MVIEKWKSLEFVNCPNYEISNLGRVHNIKTDKYLKGFLNRKNVPYRYILLADIDNKPKSLRVCRLVALCFVPNNDIKNKIFVDHIDGNSLNDVASNLRWVTRYENMNNPFTKQRLSTSHKGQVPWNKGVKTGKWNKPMSDEARKRISEGHKEYWRKRREQKSEIR